MSAKSPVLELRVVLTVEDYDKAMRFYRDALGLPLLREFGEGAERGGLLAAGVATVEIVSRAQAEAIDAIEAKGAPGAPIRIAMEVADSAGAAAKLVDAGARAAAVVDTPWGHRNVRLTAPDGLQMTLFTVTKT